MNAIWTFITDHWVITLIIGCCILSGIGDWRRRSIRDRHQRKLELIQARAVTREAPARPAPQLPAVCRHHQAVPVRGKDGFVLSWLCMNPACGEQLPPAFSLPEENH